jgi:hypothetical protein
MEADFYGNVRNYSTRSDVCEVWICYCYIDWLEVNLNEDRGVF